MPELADTGVETSTVRPKRKPISKLGSGDQPSIVRDLPDGFEAGDPLPNPIRGGKYALSEDGKREVKLLSGPRPGRFLWELAFTWLSIGVAMVAATWINNVWFYLFAIYFIGTRQNILGLLIHEQTHYLCSRKPWADAVTNLFAGWPIIVAPIESYSQVHLAHHAFYFSENDPDFVRKNGREWTFPMKIRFLFTLFFKDAIGGSFIKLITGKKDYHGISISRRPVLPSWVKFIYYLAIVGLSVWLGFWKLLLLLWFVPLLVVLPVIVRFSAICEHKYNVLGGKIEESTATILLRWWERLLLPRLNFNYHIYHHYFPNVSFANLPKVHALFEKENLVEKENLFVGYFSYFHHLMNDTHGDQEVTLQDNLHSPVD